MGTESEDGKESVKHESSFTRKRKATDMQYNDMAVRALCESTYHDEECDHQKAFPYQKITMPIRMKQMREHQDLVYEITK